jgi:hypothetical protein
MKIIQSSLFQDKVKKLSARQKTQLDDAIRHEISLRTFA